MRFLGVAYSNLFRWLCSVVVLNICLTSETSPVSSQAEIKIPLGIKHMELPAMPNLVIRQQPKVAYSSLF